MDAAYIIYPLPQWFKLLPGFCIIKKIAVINNVVYESVHTLFFLTISFRIDWD
jgi:hypothetical protein